MQIHYMANTNYKTIFGLIVIIHSSKKCEKSCNNVNKHDPI